MTNTYRCAIAVNGSTTDVDVENDSASWLGKIGALRIEDGGGDYLRASTPAKCTFTAAIPLYLAPLLRTITIAVEHDNATAFFPLADWSHSSLAAPYTEQKIVFHGVVTGAAGTPGQELVEFEAVSELSGFLNSRSRKSATANTNPGTVVGNFESSWGITAGIGAVSFPNASTSPPLQVDVPEQNNTPDGRFIQSLLAGTGVNLSCQWLGLVTAPVIQVRPDWYYREFIGGDASIDFTYQNTISWNVPQACTFDEVGFAWGDYPARIIVRGTTSAGVVNYGWARLNAAGDRTNAGNIDVTISSWIDSDTRCQGWAKRLMEGIGIPQIRATRLGIWLDHYRTVSDAVTTTDTALDAAQKLAGVMLGDRLDSTVNAAGGFQTAYQAALSTAQENDLYPLAYYVTGKGGASGPSSSAYDKWTVRGIVREWTPGGGWHLELFTVPEYQFNITDAADYGYGTEV